MGPRWIGDTMGEWHRREIAAVVRRTDVYARVSPGHKLAIVSAPQADGHAVAMTGEG